MSWLLMADRGNKARRLKDVKKYFDRYLCINIQGDLLTAPSQGTAKYICDSMSDLGEIRVYQRADFQSGSRVLKKVF